MRVVIQRVVRGSVTIENQVVGEIEKGYVILLGVCDEDDETEVERFVDKILGLRICEDENGKTNKSIEDIDGEILVVSQFTLYADCRKGRRPSFTNAGAPSHAKKLYEYFIEKCEGRVKKVAHGEFGADMKVEIINDGPFTIVLDSSDFSQGLKK
ncbi:MAG: D-aminoacyl-tRNA deacylase [Lachnospiraceae bacterium]